MTSFYLKHAPVCCLSSRIRFISLEDLNRHVLQLFITVESIRKWYQMMGRELYPQAKNLLITANGRMELLYCSYIQEIADAIITRYQLLQIASQSIKGLASVFPGSSDSPGDIRQF